MLQKKAVFTIYGVYEGVGVVFNFYGAAAFLRKPGLNFSEKCAFIIVGTKIALANARVESDCNSRKKAVFFAGSGIF